MCCGLTLCKIQDGAETHDDVHGDDDVPEQDLLPFGGDSLEQRHCKAGLAQRAADDNHELADIDKLKGQRDVCRIDIPNMLTHAE